MGILWKYLHMSRYIILYTDFQATRFEPSFMSTFPFENSILLIFPKHLL